MKHSIIIPAHNEGGTIEAHLGEFMSSLSAETREVLLEIIIVENGSTDDTLQAAERLAEAYPGLIRVMALARGSYGEAIRQGMLAAKGSHLSILECDFLDPEFVRASIDLFALGKSQFIVASKRHPSSVDRRPYKRRLLTLLFNTLLRLTTGYPGTDTHGLKSIDTALAQRLCSAACTTDEVFQTEIVLLAWRWGFRVVELPIRIRERRPAPVSIRRRFPMVAGAVWQLRHSLRRFPAQGRLAEGVA
jgi:glycosyltransferase involved in cell wall biosynthesis